MRVAFMGGSALAVQAATLLTERGHEVVVIDQDPKKIEVLADTLDCGLVTGDGSRPAVLDEVGPAQTNFLSCVSDRDEANILAALVGRSLGFDRVVPKIEDPQLEAVCTELGLEDVMVPDRHVARQLVDLVEGRDNPDLTTGVESGVRFLAITIPEGAKDLGALDLPGGVLPIVRNRDGQSTIVDTEIHFEPGDELLLIVQDEELESVRDRFASGKASADREHEGPDR